MAKEAAVSTGPIGVLFQPTVATYREPSSTLADAKAAFSRRREKERSHLHRFVGAARTIWIWPRSSSSIAVS